MLENLLVELKELEGKNVVIDIFTSVNCSADVGLVERIDTIIDGDKVTDVEIYGENQSFTITVDDVEVIDFENDLENDDEVTFMYKFYLKMI